MPRKPIGDKPMTPAERQARSRKLKAALTAKEIATRNRRRNARLFVPPRTMAENWDDAVAVLLDIQEACAEFPHGPPDAMQRPAVCDTICAIDLSVLVGAATAR